MTKEKNNITKKSKTIEETEAPINPIQTKKVGAKCRLSQYKDEIILRFSQGCSIKDSIAGMIGYNAYYDWYNAGKEDQDNGIDSEFAQFSQDVDRTLKEYRNSLLNCVRKQAPEDWRAATWLLERSDPETFNLKTKMEVKQEVEVSQKAILEIPENGRRIKTET